MLVAEKPPLDEDLLMHFGIKGMKWGHRKTRSSSSSGHTGSKQKMSTGKKVAIGAAVVGGAAAAAFILTKTGRLPIRSLGNRFRSPQLRSSFVPKTVLATPVSHIPSPARLMAEANQAAVRNRSVPAMNRTLTEKTWRDAALMRRTARESSRIPSVGEVARNLQDPNYVWHI
jgi:hypothetical protein